jgi:PAS domain S-box-containing protein
MTKVSSMPLHILIVDDEPSDRMAFRRHLNRGVEDLSVVSEASTAAQAQQQLAQAIPDCVLLDFDLPDCDGLTLVRSMVAIHGANAFGIVMLASATNIELAVEALQCGAHDFLQKHAAGPAALHRAVDNAVEKAGIQRQLDVQRRALAEKNRELEIHIAKLEREAADRKKAETLLRESEQQLRLVTDHAAVLLAHCDEECRYKFVNRPYAERFGRGPREIIGRCMAEVLGQETYETIRPYTVEVLKGKRVEFEAEVPWGSLGLRWVHIVYVPERNANGRVVGFVGVMSDTTQRKITERELERARDKAVAASRAKDDFLAALSHELRTPLNPVLLLASEAAEDPHLPEEVRAIFETIRKNVDLEARLIDDLLNITRISRGKLALDKHTVDVHAILMDAIANVGTEVDQKHLSLRMNLAAHWHTVMGDPVRLQQVFWNVFKNAVKFTAEGGAITVMTRSMPEQDELEISVKDTGIGMTEEELGRVFDAFAQGEHAGDGGSHRFGGLGLGLAISRMLVQSHSGRIEAHSEGPGQGATFTIHLPLAPQVPEQPLPVPPNGAAKPAVPDTPWDAAATHILLVEDHEPTRTALAHLLRRRNFHVTVAGCVTEALQVAAGSRFDLLLSDIGLPDGTGYDLMMELSARQGIKGIALTGYGMEKDVARSNAAGFHSHLTKPIRMQSLESAILAALRGSSAG